MAEPALKVAHTSKKVDALDRLSLESAIMDARGDYELLALAYEDLLGSKVDPQNLPQNWGDYTTLRLTRGQVAAFDRAVTLVSINVHALEEAFYGPNIP